jgi:hypothetical protein
MRVLFFYNKNKSFYIKINKMCKKNYIKMNNIKLIKNPSNEKIEILDNGNIKFKKQYNPEFLYLNY